ncbi:MAG: prepilin-type N-terminal cleavage/methylation domain-containing protein [Phycisphaerae bacterium]|nr:prepilin-type N-terminal cleavage/methylation domain-containing protein [Phycisphaerae bacterium]
MKNLRWQRGFSLTELLIVVAVLLVLMGALMGVGTHLKRQGQENLCRGTLEILVAAIEQYYEFHQQFPAQSANLYRELYSLPQSRAICEKIQKSLTANAEFLDPWGRPLRYTYAVGQTFPLITSAGPDRVLGTGDDISSR